MLRKILCFLGKHEYQTPIIASLDTYWLQCGQECKHCGKFEVSKKELNNLFPWVYQRGKDRAK